MTDAKINTALQTRMNTLANQELIPIIVRHKKGSFSSQSVLPGLPSIDCKFNLFPGEAFKVTPAAIEALSRHDDVEQIWPDLPVYTCLNTSIPKIQTPNVWSAGFNGQGIKVAVVDTGIDDTHPDFTGRIIAAKSFVGLSARDDNGHGTHVAGTIAGSGAKSNGKYVGVAPAAHLYIAKALRADGSSSMSLVMAAIEWAVLEQHAQIINLSLGGTIPGDGADALSVLCDEAVLQAGVVMCVAAGNAGPNDQTIGPPGCARYAITVGAIDDNDHLARFSSRGPTTDGRVKPDIVFPGVGIVAPQAAGTQLGAVIAEGYVASDGTSMATPHASGVAALMLQANPQLTAAQVKTLLLAGGVNVGALPNEQGTGRGDAYQAYLQAITPAATPPVVTPPTTSPAKPAGCLAAIFGRK